LTESTAWIDPDGVTWPLEVDWDVSGRFMPRVEFVSDGVPGQPGEFFREARHGVREFMLSVDITGTTEANLRSTLRSFVASMDPTRGAGRIRVTSPVGDQREIVCRYSAGLEMEERLGGSGPNWQQAAIKFVAHDPYWYDVSPTSKTFTVTALVPSFFPIFPLRLTASELAVDDTVDNTGDVAAWPVWTVNGPGSGIKLSNLTTGRLIYLPSTTLVAGQTLVIDTRPGYKSTVIDSTTNSYSALSADSSLWALERGVNIVRLEMSGADNDYSGLTLSYHRRFLSP
jgi:phage-related protein